jgi:hypothetical protein
MGRRRHMDTEWEDRLLEPRVVPALPLAKTICRNQGTPTDRVVSANYRPVRCRALFLTGQTPAAKS